MRGDAQLGFDVELNPEYLAYNERQTKTRSGIDITKFVMSGQKDRACTQQKQKDAP